MSGRSPILGLAVLLSLNAGYPARAAHSPPSAALPPVPVAIPALPPLPPSPVESFRRLLNLSPEEQGQVLAERPEPQRRLLEAKLIEYRLLPPDERTWRLEATELRWYLRPLMETPPTNRPAQIASVPAKYRALVGNRLRQWDAISASAQREILQNESTIRYVLRWRTATVAQQDAAREGLSPSRRDALDRELARWQALPQERRDRMCRQFEQFFELPGKTREKALERFSDAERRHMESTLRAFALLPSDQRQACVSSFRKFADLSAAERAEFLESADRWKALTPAERETWRKLVLQLPPLPPGSGEPPLPPSGDPGAGTAPPLPR